MAPTGAREARLEHNLRGFVGAHLAAKAKLGEPVDENFLRRLLEEDAMTEEVAIGWGDRLLKVRGLAMLVCVGLFIALATLLWINQRSFAEIAGLEQARQKALAAAVQVREEQARTAAVEHQQISQALEAVIYVLTLSDEQRKALRLRTPDKIRDLERR